MAGSHPDKGVPSRSVPQQNAGNTVFGQATVPPSPGQVATPTITPDQLAERLIQSGLMSAAVLQALTQHLKPLTTDSLIANLVSSKKLTRFQIDTILAGQTSTLFVGEYLLLEKIGAGGMGQVFRALHRSMNRVVALKVLPPEAVPSKDTVQRFLREVQAVAKLSHPNIVTAHDAGEQGGRPYLAMEFVPGMDLHSHVQRKGPLPIAEALDLTVQTARGLHYAHSAGVIHRDIKPLNLLRNAEGIVKILDLGLAKVKGDATVTAAGVAMGTPDFLSPEQGLNAAAVDHRTDIYSLGCTLYFLLTGKPVYQGDSLVKIIMAHQHSPIPSLRQARPDVSEELDAVFQKMVAKKPEGRYQSMTEVMTALTAVQKGLEVRPRKRTSALAAALAVSALVGTGAILFWAMSNPGGHPRPTTHTSLLTTDGTTKPGETTGTLVVEIDQPDADAFLNDEPLKPDNTSGKGLVSISVEEGTHDLTIAKKGFNTYSEEVKIKAGATLAIKVHLEPVLTKANTITVSLEKFISAPRTYAGKIVVFERVQMSGKLEINIRLQIHLKTAAGKTVGKDSDTKGIEVVVLEPGFKKELQRQMENLDQAKYYPANLTCRIERGPLDNHWLAIVSKVEFLDEKK